MLRLFEHKTYLMRLKNDYSFRLLDIMYLPHGRQNMSMGFLRCDLPDANFRRAATHRLQKHFPDKSKQVWRSTRDWQSRLALSRPRYGFLLNLLMRYFEWNLSHYRALQEHGMSQADAGEFVEMITAGITNLCGCHVQTFTASQCQTRNQSQMIIWDNNQVLLRPPICTTAPAIGYRRGVRRHSLFGC